MTSLIAALSLVCAGAVEGPVAKLRHGAPCAPRAVEVRAWHGLPRSYDLAGAARHAGLDLRALPGRLTASVERVLRGVTLIDAQPGSAAPHPTFQLRPCFGSKGPLALFDLRF